MHGHVRSVSRDGPIAMIEVSVDRPDRTLIDRAHTNDDGSYSVGVSAGETVTVRFDTRHSLDNRDSRQPSPVTEVVADHAVTLDRRPAPEPSVTRSRATERTASCPRETSTART
ncbi:hypothetical protein WB401_44315 [Streptomyces brasiliscabiei]|uniref:Carboxypeptidase regulatory-like domain-containing protein n=1 Tax=Streptomyces brasiliscabiei TaxID=2736302 RepID=A0ABU8GUJ5_9ACTN